MSKTSRRLWQAVAAVATSCVLVTSQARAQQTTSGTPPDTAAGKAVGLPGVTVTGKSAVDPRMIGFEAHRAKEFGRFLTREQLDKLQGKRLSEVLSKLSGAVQIERGGEAHAAYVANRQQQAPATLRHAARQCFVQIILDGMRVYGPNPLGDVGEVNPDPMHPSAEPNPNPPPDINQFHPEALEGVEFYSSPSSTPVEYRNGQSECGTLVLWTRTR